MTPDADTPLHWHACPRDSVAMLDFGDSAALYHRPSGQTHFLNAAALLLLDELWAAPATTTALADTLAQATDGSVDASAAAVSEHLARLDHLGLVSSR